MTQPLSNDVAWSLLLLSVLPMHSLTNETATHAQLGATESHAGKKLVTYFYTPTTDRGHDEH